MKRDIILAGVGGQGILSIATIIGYAAVEMGLHLKQAEVHGMSQRGGDVQSHLRISDKEIFSDLIPFGGADVILSVEPMESLRYMPYLSEDGYLVTNSKPFINITDYPEIDVLENELNSLSKKVVLDADAMAKEAGNARAMNMVMLGAASPFLEISADKLEAAIEAIFGRKGEKVVALNIKAFRAGRQLAENNR